MGLGGRAPTTCGVRSMTRSREPSTTSGLRMTVETFRAEVLEALLAHAWEQWAQLGLSAVAPTKREERAADPEALVLFTLVLGRSDPRLLGELLDWLARNEPLISLQRLRNLCLDPTDRRLVDATTAWVSGVRRPRSLSKQVTARTDLELLFPALPAPGPELDPVFAAQGFARAPLQPSGKSQAPHLADPIAFAMRLRRLLGVGVRAEVVRTLLTVRAPRLSGRVITASAAFAQRNVREGLMQLSEAGVVTVVSVADDRHYGIEHGDWATLLGLGSAPRLPLHGDWIPAYRALTRILRWLHEPGVDDLSPYLRASQARTLVEEISTDLRYVGVPHGLYAARGEKFWDEFVLITRLAIRHLSGE
jgi:hypothetical protein